MSHTSNKIYVDTTNGVGISIADLQTILQTTRNDVGGIITNALVNKWAKYKPVKMAGLDFPNQRNSDFTWKTVAQIEALPEAVWWKGYNGQCGMTFQTFTSFGTNNMTSQQSFFHELLAGNLNWGYERPSGGIGQYPYRFFDFNQYLHDAPKPVTGVYDNLRISANNTLTVQLDQTHAESGLGLELSDFVISNVAVSGWYVGILIWYSNNANEYTFAFSSGTISGGNLDVTFTNMAFFGGKNVTIVPFLSSINPAQGQDPGGCVCLSCDVAPQQVLIRGSYAAVDADISGIWASTFHERVSYGANIINNTGNQVTITDLRISLYEDNVEVAYKPNRTITIALDGQWQESSMLQFNYTYDPTKTYTVRMTGDTPIASIPHINISDEVNDPRNS